MERKTYILKNDIATLEVNVPVKNGFVITSEFCPQELLATPDLNIGAFNGEPEEVFIEDCERLMIGMSRTEDVSGILDLHVAGLMTVVMSQIATAGKLIFDNLLILMDCFSHLLKADGMDEEEIRNIYPAILRSIVNLYPCHVFYNCLKLETFAGSDYEKTLDRLIASGRRIDYA